MGLQELSRSEQSQAQEIKIDGKKYWEASAVFPNLCLFTLIVNISFLMVWISQFIAYSYSFCFTIAEDTD